MSETSSPWSAERYNKAMRGVWDNFVHSSKNGTFLFRRDYMDYHADRFEDHSFVIRMGRDVAALMPANRAGDVLYSHQGLTYGGVITDERMTTLNMLDLFGCLIQTLRAAGFRRLIYKTVPSIYHRLPAEEDRYALFHYRARLIRRDVLCVIPRDRRAPIQKRRRRALIKADKYGVSVRETPDFARFWALLTDHLRERFGVDPVHTLAEMERLHNAFPAGIRLFEAFLHGESIAGIVVFESPMVAHAQYIASSSLGRDVGAIEAIVHYLIDDIFQDKSFFDFGSSNGVNETDLNRGLIEQKEGFGARAIVQDFYEIEM